jgi:heme-degrading monooxygenase HmoA
MHLVLSRFTVANGMRDDVAAAFRARPHRVDRAAGFVRMEVAQAATNPDEFLLLTWWLDEASFATWHRSHAYQASHAGIPKGLKLVPKSSRVEAFDFLCS